MKSIYFRYNQDIKILHFIGETKPWNQQYDANSQQVQTPPGYNHLQGFLQLWWDLFVANVHPTLSAEMVSWFGQKFGHLTALPDGFFDEENLTVFWTFSPRPR